VNTAKPGSKEHKVAIDKLMANSKKRGILDPSNELSKLNAPRKYVDPYKVQTIQHYDSRNNVMSYQNTHGKSGWGWAYNPENTKSAMKFQDKVILEGWNAAKFGADAIRGCIVRHTKYTVDDRSIKSNVCNLLMDNYVKITYGRKTIWDTDILKKVNETRTKQKATRKRKLLAETNNAALWKEFVAYVKGGQSTSINCRNGRDMLSGVTVYEDGSFSFACSNTGNLCNCISDVGSSKVQEQIFSAGKLSLILFSHRGQAAYEIQENGEALAYGDVNSGRVDRRRRLMQDGGGGGS